MGLDEYKNGLGAGMGISGIVLIVLVIGALIVESCGKTNLEKEAIHRKFATYNEDGDFVWVDATEGNPQEEENGKRTKEKAD